MIRTDGTHQGDVGTPPPPGPHGQETLSSLSYTKVQAIIYERLFDQKVMLRLWVKVRAGWSDDERALKSLGYDER